MSRLRLDGGARPWLPAADVASVCELDRHNVPLAGVVEQSGEKFLFTCLLGEEDADNVWAYAPVSDEEIAGLGAHTGEAFLDALDATLKNKPLVVAFADDLELEAWYMIDAGEEGPLTIAQRFLTRWRRDVEEQRQHTQELGRKRELADALSR